MANINLNIAKFIKIQKLKILKIITIDDRYYMWQVLDLVVNGPLKDNFVDFMKLKRTNL